LTADETGSGRNGKTGKTTLIGLIGRTKPGEKGGETTLNIKEGKGRKGAKTPVSIRESKKK